jgi:hypothetical protein
MRSPWVPDRARPGDAHREDSHNAELQTVRATLAMIAAVTAHR